MCVYVHAAPAKYTKYVQGYAEIGPQYFVSLILTPTNDTTLGDDKWCCFFISD